MSRESDRLGCASRKLDRRSVLLGGTAVTAASTLSANVSVQVAHAQTPAASADRKPTNPGSVQAYPDPLITAVATPDSVARAKEIEAYTLGVSAYLWGYPLVRMERIMREYTDVRAPQPATSYRAALNRIGWATALATPLAKDMPTANNDTLYMSAVVALTEPYVLSVPDTKDRYYVINVFTTYHEDEHDIGRRTTGTKAGRFAIVPPGWKGELPADLKRLDVSTDKVWLWGRLHVRDGEDPAAVEALLPKFDLRPLSQLASPKYAATAAALPSLPDIAGDELGFFAHLGYAMQHNPILPRDAALVGQFERIALTPKGFDRSKLSPEQIRGLRRALDDAPVVASAAITTTSIRKDGWDWAVLDGYGFNYPLRAVHSGPYLGGNSAREALYPNTYVDSENNPLTGAHRYELRFTKAPPVDAFWSLTIYNADDKMLVDNPINRYKVGSETPGLKVSPDGSFTILIQHDQLQGPDKTNWLPAPAGKFNLFLRFYQPRPEILNGSYTLPHLVKMP
ncbi:DUF1214 domain-containing protein [Enterovirga sp.]|uniref:DUF1254 domain-containing protein n=1 Tax=Enterovirga sp. TaxID=2026350 RepID=UPI002BF30C9B|nr:DUF1214 domain-containing protein [Enterovirga sp.]HMO30205.1 DUF1214 domain-containing protein [Enterovirga sp.]